MATIYKRPLKNGKLNYAIQIKVKGADGRSKFVCTTWKNENNLSGVRAEKAATAFAEQWEREYREGHIHELSMATFEQVANVWLNTRKYNMSDNYYLRAVECIKRMSNFFGNKRFVDLKAFDIQQFFVNMNESLYKVSRAKIKPNKAVEFDELVKAYGVKKASRESSFNRPTLYYARKGEMIELNSAKLICEFFNLNTFEYFDKITIEKHYRKETIMKYKRVLSTIYNYAMSIELVNRNYATSAYLKNVIGGEPSKEIEILTHEEFDNFMKVLDREEDVWKIIPLYILATTGIRTCELCGLEWQDIDLENRLIKIRRNRLYINNKGVITKELKTKYSKRTLHICNRLYDKLVQFKELYDRLKENDKKFDKCGAIFCNLDGTPRFPHYLNKLLKSYLMKAGCKKVSCHKIRHTWITRMVSQGVPVNVVSKLAGHANSDITLKIYTHYCQDIDNSIDAMEKIFA